MQNKEYETKMVEHDVEVKVVKPTYAELPERKGVSLKDTDEFLKSRGYKSKAAAEKDGWKFS